MMLLERLRIRKAYIFNLAIYFILLCYSYYFYFYIYQDYTYQVGYSLSLNYFKLIEAIVFTVSLGALYLYYDISDSIYLTYSFILYVLLFVPFTVFYWMSNNYRQYFYMVVTAFLILELFFIAYKYFFSTKREKNTRFNYEYILLFVFAVFLIVNIFAYLKYGHSLYYLINLDEVYNIRYESREKIPTYFKYILQWSALVVIPTSIAYITKIKKYYLLIIPLTVQLLIFTINGSKFYLFSLLINLFVFLIYSGGLMNFMLPALNLFITFVLLWKNNFVMSVGIRRAFFVPQSLSFVYYEFFKSHPKLYLSSSFLKRFVENIYSLDSPFIISRYVYHEPKMSANVNFIANAYSHLGFIGIVLFAIILALILLAFEYFSENNVNRKFVVLISFSSFLALVNSSLLTTLKTHGLLIAMIMSVLFLKSFRD
ncbi:hypothetical protein ABG79_00777 [Caloramator mitchellensis]|uniref:Uncharacterized protein n=1 Tax=Caloramator mitchellensis TaxID=908809 RepID=A0A0R3K4Z5_CALMK|nr:oligosaccharide repeat unit polymerase [Caloramator mitchellensis]KRQ87439.1 hypothetical protein ABG79_00777 [Caloramator mitchellensis]